MNLSALIKPIKLHSPIILSALAGVGTIATAYFAGKASYEAAGMIRRFEEENHRAVDNRERLKERTKLVWKLYIPAAISATTTILCVFGSNKMGTKKALATQAVLSVTQQAFDEYRDKVISEFGEHKHISIRDKVAEDRVTNNPPPSKEVMFTGPGVVLCCEMFTGRYFTSDMDSLLKAVNELNADMLKQEYATLDDFYYIIDLKPTSNSGRIGWYPDKLMELVFTTVLTPDGRPCLAFDYNYTKPL
ncbi:MAG: DUF6353 family protein [Paenisporosarcina sp.]